MSKVYEGPTAGTLLALGDANEFKRFWWCQGTRITDEGAVDGVLPGSKAWQDCFEGRITRHSDCGWVLVVRIDGEGAQ